MGYMATKMVAYLRVSTTGQGRSGLGLEAQRAAVERHAANRNGEVVEWFTEIESGKVNTREKLAEALDLSRLTGATLVIAKLDRLSRNAAFLLALRESGVRFVAADMPDANELTVGIMALVAQQEREAISSRTKEALAAAKRRGVKLGNPNGSACLAPHQEKRIETRRQAGVEAANTRARDLAKTLDALARAGVTTYSGIAAALNARGVLTPRRKTWHPTSVSNVMARLAASRSG